MPPTLVTPADLRTLADALSLQMLDHRQLLELLEEVQRGGALLTGLASRAGIDEGVLRTLVAPARQEEIAKETVEPSATTAKLERPAPASPDAFGRYEEVSEVGRGGMGCVLRAFDPDLRREIAIKVLQGDDATLLHKFGLEAQVTGQLQHPNIIAIHESGAIDGRPYFTMPLVRGHSLGEVFDANRQPAWPRARLLEAFVKICDAMAYAHDQGVIHRDLKPDNVMIGAFGEVLVMDWGLARAEGAQDVQASQLLLTDDRSGEALRTMAGTIMGTPAYMPPEQARGEVDRLGPRSDIYSLGALLYQMLTGAPPYEGATAWKVLDDVASGDRLEPPSARAGRLGGEGVPAELEAVVLKAMDARPGARYASAIALREDVQAYLDGGVLSAARYSPAQLLWRWLRRHRLAVAGVLLAVLAAGGGALWSRLQAQRAADSRLRAKLVEVQTRAELRRAAVGRADAAPIPAAATESAMAQPWFDAQAVAIDALDRLAWMAADEPEVREAIGLDALRSERERICRRAWSAAADRGQFALARSWVARAEAVGGPQAAALASVEAAQAARLEEQLTRARTLLQRARERELLAGGAQLLADASQELLAMRTPQLCRLLMEARYLASDSDLERLLSIRGLGKLSDATTRDAAGQTAPRLLARMLAGCQLPADDELITELGAALTRLADGSIYDRELAELLAREDALATRVLEVLGGLEIPPYRGAERFDALMQRARLSTISHLPRSLELLERAEKADPSRPEPGLMRVGIYIQRRSIKAAAAEMQRLQARHGETNEVLAMRSWLRIFERRPRESLADAQRVLASDARHLLALTNRAHALLDLGQVARSIVAATEALDVAPRDYRARLLRGRAQLLLRRLPQSTIDLTACIQRQPRKGEALLWRATGYRQAGSPLEALRDLDACIRNDGKRLAAYIERSRLLTSLGASGRAVRGLKLVEPMMKTRRYYPYWWALAKAQAALGETDAARASYRRAIEEAPASQKGSLEAELRALR